jgi:prepilin-type N-terminal cleavage/methylation domain-containing protein
MRQRGWTLKEILVVLAIIAALAALLYPIGQIVRYRVLEAKCRSNLWAIYTKYKLMKTQNGGRWDREIAKEFNQWLVSPEGLKVRFCPLSGEAYTVIPSRYAHPDLGDDPYFITRVDVPGGRGSFEIRLRDHLIAYCDCHTKPPRPRCGHPYVGPLCYLSVLDIGDGKMDYGVDSYTRDAHTGKRIWPPEGSEGQFCPDPRLLPDVSKGY